MCHGLQGKSSEWLFESLLVGAATYCDGHTTGRTASYTAR